jgi:hypothetical protein
MRVEFRWCPGCSTQTLFEQPPCEDGHGTDCLDLACMECGFGITLRDLTPVRVAQDAQGKDSSAA